MSILREEKKKKLSTCFSNKLKRTLSLLLYKIKIYYVELEKKI